MQAQSARKVRTFSIGNESADYDEADAASAVARHLGTEHTGLTIRGEDAARLAGVDNPKYEDAEKTFRRHSRTDNLFEHLAVIPA